MMRSCNKKRRRSSPVKRQQSTRNQRQKSVEMAQFSNKKIQTSEKGTNTDAIKLFLVNKLLEATQFDVSRNYTQVKKTPYCHPNYNKCLFQQTNHRQNQYKEISEDLNLFKEVHNFEIKEVITT